MTPQARHARQVLVREYSRLAVEYDARWSRYLQATTRHTLDWLDPRPIDRVLDVGCGTGALLHELARTHDPALLAGIDPVAPMLDKARRRLPPQVRLDHGWAERLPFDDAAFDAVICCNMLHYVPQPMDALRQMHRVLRPGGQLLLTDWCADDVRCRWVQRGLRLLGRAHSRALRRSELRRLLAQVGLEVVGHKTYRVGWQWGMMTMKSIKRPHPAHEHLPAIPQAHPSRPHPPYCKGQTP